MELSLVFRQARYIPLAEGEEYWPQGCLTLQWPQVGKRQIPKVQSLAILGTSWMPQTDKILWLHKLHM